MSIVKVMDGNSAGAEALKQVNPDVVVAYPVLPSAPMIEKIAMFTAEGKIDTELVNVESWPSVMNGCIGAASAGGRTFTATASHGLAQMHDMLFTASSLRLPIVMGVTDRSLSAPVNLHPDHSDTMSQRDCGWIQFFCEDPQEVYDNIIQAYKVAENPDVRTPVMVAMDGWITSHTFENLLVETDPDIKEFVGKFSSSFSLLDTEHPVTIGSASDPSYYYQYKLSQAQGFENARKVIKDIGKEFGDRFGRYYGYFESYKLEDAEYAVIIMSSAAGTVKEAVDRLRAQGEKAGVLKLRVFRPFPFNELREKLQSLKAIAVLDRDFSPGTQGGPLFNEIRSALYSCKSQSRPQVYPYIFGLGGREIEVEDIETLFREIKDKNGSNIMESGITFLNMPIGPEV